MHASDALEVLLRLAAQEAYAAGRSEILPAHLLIALARLSDPDQPPLWQEFTLLGIDPRAFRRRLRGILGSAGGMPPAPPRPSRRCDAVMAAARAQAAQQGEPLEARHVLRAVLATLGDGGVSMSAPPDNPTRSADLPLGGLTRRVRALRQQLLGCLHGQDQAVHAFVEGLFEIEMASHGDRERRKPAGLFLFAGPPGVGKTYLAELAGRRGTGPAQPGAELRDRAEDRGRRPAPGDPLPQFPAGARRSQRRRRGGSGRRRASQHPL